MVPARRRFWRAPLCIFQAKKSSTIILEAMRCDLPSFSSHCLAVGGKRFPKVGALFRMTHSALDEGRHEHGSRPGGGYYATFDDYDVFLDSTLLLVKWMPDSWFSERLQQTTTLLGKAAPELRASRWLNVSEPLAMRNLHGKVVLLDFWGVWCGACIKPMPKVNELYERYKDRGLVVIAMHSQMRSKLAGEFVLQKKLSLPVAIDNGETVKRYGVAVWPSYFLIDKKGSIRRANLTRMPQDEEIVRLLAEKNL